MEQDKQFKYNVTFYRLRITIAVMESNKYRVFNLKVDRQLSREYFTSDPIYNGSAGMTLYYYMCRRLARLLQERGEPVLAIRIS